MQKRIPFLLLLSTFFPGHAFAQQASITGKVADTLDRKAMFNSAVMLLRSSDSILIRFARTDKAGNFLLKDIPAGRFLLLVSHHAYADYIDEVNVRDSSPIVLPLIPLVLKSTLLQTVVVRGNKGAIHIKGDTVEFRADSFYTQAGATVEDLLKKLPGIQVDKQGKITAQGEIVQKVLVDGEEFFGDDPTLVTQNLRADMVDKVQVFDKKSEQAAFTGVDDGVRNKTINLQLKDNRKNGFFGKAGAGAGTDGYYDNQAMINLFAGKRKMAAYGILSKTGKTGLDWREQENYGQSFGGGSDYDPASDQYSFTGNLNNDDDVWNGRYNGQGLPTVQTGGVHYNDKWSEDRKSVNANYKLMQLAVSDSNSTNSEYILPDTLYYNNQVQRSDNRILRQTGDVSYEYKFDSTSSLKFMADGGTDHKTIHTFNSSEALASDSSLVNQNTRTLSNIGDIRRVNSDLLWRKRLPKKGRNLSVNLRENYTGGSSSGYLNSTTRLYSKGLSSGDSVIDQYKHYHTDNFLLDAKLAYSEPLSTSSSLYGVYGITLNNSGSDRSSFSRGADNKYSVQDSLYSNNYRYNVFTQTGGLTYTLVKKNFRFNIGNNIGFTRFDQRDLGADTMIRRTFTNWYPQTVFSWLFTQQRRLSFRYNGATTQPTLQQLQPVLTNEDPLNISIGNPGLKPQFRHQLNLNFYDYKLLTSRAIWVFFSGSFTNNAISSQVTVDSSGKRVTQFVNLNGNYTFNGSLEYYFKWSKTGMDISAELNSDLSNNVSVVDNLLNSTHSGDYKLGLNMGKSKEKLYDLGVHAFAMYTQSRSSINTGITTRYWTFDIDPNLRFFLPGKLEIGADADLSLRQRTSVFDKNVNVVLLNGWIGKKMLKNDALQLKLTGNDLLDQNIGFNRSVNSNFISQNSYSTIKRYLLFSVTWNFTRAGEPLNH